MPRQARASDLSAVILAALHGRVETLFVALETQCWGLFDLETQDIQLGSEEAPAGLFYRACIQMTDGDPAPPWDQAQGPRGGFAR